MPMMDLTFNERVVMTATTGLTNLFALPALYCVYKQRQLLGFWTGVLTFVSSFMYHMMESVGCERFYLTAGDWHRVDNIGSILVFISLSIYLMDNRSGSKPFDGATNTSTDVNLYFAGLILTLCMQTKHPWELQNTIIPVLLYLVLFIGKITIYGAGTFDRYYLKLGGGIMILALICFAKGLDDDNDYLRIWHGMWHLTGSYGNFYLW